MRRGETDTGPLAAAILIAVILLMPIVERLVTVMERRENRLSPSSAAAAPAQPKVTP